MVTCSCFDCNKGASSDKSALSDRCKALCKPLLVLHYAHFRLHLGAKNIGGYYAMAPVKYAGRCMCIAAN